MDHLPNTGVCREEVRKKEEGGEGKDEGGGCLLSSNNFLGGWWEGWHINQLVEYPLAKGTVFQIEIHKLVQELWKNYRSFSSLSSYPRFSGSPLNQFR